MLIRSCFCVLNSVKILFIKGNYRHFLSSSIVNHNKMCYWYSDQLNSFFSSWISRLKSIKLSSPAFLGTCSGKCFCIRQNLSCTDISSKIGPCHVVIKKTGWTMDYIILVIRALIKGIMKKYSILKLTIHMFWIQFKFFTYENRI